MHIFRAYKINYLYIFEVDPRNAMTYFQMYAFGLFMLAIMVFLTENQMTIFILDNHFLTDVKLPMVMLTTIFIVIMFWPSKGTFYGHARFAILKTFGHIAIAPFGPVRFRTFFFANILTSSTIMFNDFAQTVCFYQKGTYHGDTVT